MLVEDPLMTNAITSLGVFFLITSIRPFVTLTLLKVYSIMYLLLFV